MRAKEKKVIGNGSILMWRRRIYAGGIAKECMVKKLWGNDICLQGGESRTREKTLIGGAILRWQN